MDLSRNLSIRFDAIEVLPSRRQVLVDGQAAALGARAFDLLLVLIQERDKVLSKDDLLARVWPGLVVEENNLTVQVSALRKLLGAEAIVTVAGRGYRFVKTQVVFEEPRLDTATQFGPAGQSLSPPMSPATAVERRRLPTRTFRRADDHPALPDKPSIAVLPFDNISGDADQGYFTDGLTEDITTELSRFRGLFVIARNSAFTYKGRAVDVRQVARELGVRYVLEGSARRAGNRVRVNAQLIDAISGNHIWAEKYDRVLDDVFVLQEDLAQSIVSAIALQVRMTEQTVARRIHPGNLRAHDMALRASADSIEASRRNDRALWLQALGEARQALALDEGNLLAHLVIAEIQTRHVAVPQFADGDLTVDWKEGIASAGRAMELDPTDSRAFGYAGFLMALAGFYDEGLGYARQGVTLNPNDYYAKANLAATQVWAGDHSQALVHLAAAERLSPRDPIRYLINAMRTSACFFLRDFDAAMEFAQESVREAPRSVMSQIGMVLASAGLEQFDRAKTAFAVVQGISPAYAKRALTQEPSFRKAEDRQRFASAVRRSAGMANGA